MPIREGIEYGVNEALTNLRSKPIRTTPDLPLATRINLLKDKDPKRYQENMQRLIQLEKDGNEEARKLLGEIGEDAGRSRRGYEKLATAMTIAPMLPVAGGVALKAMNNPWLSTGFDVAAGNYGDAAVGLVTDLIPFNNIFSKAKSLYGNLRSWWKSRNIVNPENIGDIIKYVNSKPTKKINKDNFVEIIMNSSDEDLDKLRSKISYWDGDWGLIEPIILSKKGYLHNYSTNINDAMQKMRHGYHYNNKFIDDATKIIDNEFKRYIDNGGNNALRIHHLNETKIPAKKYISHGVSLQNLRRSIADRNAEAIMPSLAILPQNTDSAWGEVLFIGDNGILSKSKIYNGDAFTPTVGMVDDISNKTNNQILQEMINIPNQRPEVKEILESDVNNTNWTRSIVSDDVVNQNSFSKWFFENVPTKAVPGDTQYLEAKYHGLFPFNRFKHVLIPEQANDIVDWASKNNIPYTIYSDYNKNGKLKRYPSLQKNLENSELLFKKGGKTKQAE